MWLSTNEWNRMSLPFELRKKIFAFAEPSGDELKVFLCDSHSPELRKKRTTPPYRPPRPISRSLLRVSRQVQAEAKDFVDHRRTLVACSMLCANDSLKMVPEDELNMTKALIISRTLHGFIFCFQSVNFERQSTEHIRHELLAFHFETAELIRTKTKEEGGAITFENEFEVGRSRKGDGGRAETELVEDPIVNWLALYLIRAQERIWRLYDTLWKFSAPR